MKLAYYATLVAVVLLAAACATPAREAASAARNTLEQRTAAPLREIGFTPIPLGESVRADLDTRSVVVLDGERRTYARGFRLPDIDGPMALSIRSYRFGTAADAGIVYPDVRFLDGDFRVIGRVPAERYSYRKMDTGEGLAADVFLDRKSGACYVLITERSVVEAEHAVSQSNVSGGIPLIVPVPGGVIAWMIPTGSSLPEVRLIAAPSGRITILLDRYRLNTIDPQTSSPPATGR